MKGYLRRRQQNEDLAVSVYTFFPHYILLYCCMHDALNIFFSQRRIVMLNEEVDRGMGTWKKKQEEQKMKEEHRKSLLLKPKGKVFLKKKSQS